MVNELPMSRLSFFQFSRLASIFCVVSLLGSTTISAQLTVTHDFLTIGEKSGQQVLSIDDDNFAVNIPNEFLVLERSFSHYTTVTGDPCNSAGSSNLKIDNASLSIPCAAGTWYGPVSAIVLSQDTPHQVSISDSSGASDSIQGSAAISLLYLPPP